MPDGITVIRLGDGTFHTSVRCSRGYCGCRSFKERIFPNHDLGCDPVESFESLREKGYSAIEITRYLYR
jgi:hypothetical protein